MYIAALWLRSDVNLGLFHTVFLLISMSFIYIHFCLVLKKNKNKKLNVNHTISAFSASVKNLKIPVFSCLRIFFFFFLATKNDKFMTITLESNKGNNHKTS